MQKQAPAHRWLNLKPFKSNPPRPDPRAGLRPSGGPSVARQKRPSRCRRTQALRSGAHLLKIKALVGSGLQASPDGAETKQSSQAPSSRTSIRLHLSLTTG